MAHYVIAYTEFCSGNLICEGTMVWDNGWEMVGSVSTLLLIVTAIWQIRSVRLENQVERTLAACSRYESDSTIERCVRELRPAHLDPDTIKLSREYQHAAVVVLNFLDTIAIGIDQGLYIDRLARDHMEAIVRKWTDFLLEPQAAKTLGVERRDYRCLIALGHRWDRNEIYYGRGSLRRLRRG